MSVRTSSRSNKGKNKYLTNLLIEEEKSMEQKQKQKKQKKQKKQIQKTTEVVRCIACNTNDSNYNEETDPNGNMIQCDKCDTWQHIKCMTNGTNDIKPFLNENSEYFCERCNPQNYPHLVKQQEPEVENDSIQEEDFGFGESDNESEEIINGLEDDNHINNVIEQNDDDDDAYTDDENNNALQNFKDEEFIENDDEDFDEDIKKKKRHAKTTLKSLSSIPSSKKKRKKTPENKKDLKSNTNIKANITPPDPNAKIRQNAKKMFIDLFNKYIIPDTLNEKLYSIPENSTSNLISNASAEQLENALYEVCFDKETNQLSKIYTEKVRSLFSNLKDKKNLLLKSHVLNKVISFDKLVRMGVNELANPDLQEIKEEMDAKSLNKFTIEKEENPLYIKTHKGDELIEGSNDFDQQDDQIYSKDNINRRVNDNEDDEDSENQTDQELKLQNDSHPNSDIDSTEESPEKIALKRVDINYDEVSWKVSGNLKYLGASIPMDKSVYRDALSDGQLSVEGKLSSDKAFEYLHEVKSMRNVVSFQLIDPSDTESDSNIHSMTDSLLLSGKILGIRPKTNYEKVIYVIPAKDNTIPHTFQDIYGNDEIFTSSVESFDRALFIVFIIKPELAR